MQQQLLGATFPRIRDCVRELLGRMDALARRFHRFELDYEETRWVEILTTECGFFRRNASGVFCGPVEATTPL